MNCPRCRGVVPAGAAFCPNCGNDLRAFLQPPKEGIQPKGPERTVAAPAGYYQPPTPNVQAPKKSNLGWIVSGVLALALAILGLFAMNLLNKTAKQPDGPMLGKTERNPEPVLQQTGKQEPITQKTAEAPIQMPDDIRRWLEHLEATEKKREKLAKKGLANLMILAQTAQLGMDLDGLRQLAQGDPDMAEPKTSADKVGESAEQTRAEWKQLRADFESYPPPGECQPIAQNYTNALSETGAMMADILDAIAVSKEDTQKALNSLYGMQNASKSIDEYGDATDSGVAEICEKYNTRKWFSIAKDFGNSSLLGSFGTR